MALPLLSVRDGATADTELEIVLDNVLALVLNEATADTELTDELGAIDDGFGPGTCGQHTESENEFKLLSADDTFAELLPQVKERLSSLGIVPEIPGCYGLSLKT